MVRFKKGAVVSQDQKQCKTKCMAGSADDRMVALAVDELHVPRHLCEGCWVLVAKSSL